MRRNSYIGTAGVTTSARGSGKLVELIDRAYALQASMPLHSTYAGTYNIGPYASDVNVDLMLWGGGGGGGGSGSSKAGGGGAASKVAFLLKKGQTVPVVVGEGGLPTADGEDTTATLPDGRVVTAGGGKAPVGFAGGLGGAASGGDLNRAGGQGGYDGTDYGAGIGSGVAGEFGGAGGAPSGGASGGGGAGGFTDLGVKVGGKGSLGTLNSVSSIPGGGSGSAEDDRASSGGMLAIVTEA